MNENDIITAYSSTAINTENGKDTRLASPS